MWGQYSSTAQCLAGGRRYAIAGRNPGFYLGARPFRKPVAIFRERALSQRSAPTIHGASETVMSASSSPKQIGDVEALFSAGLAEVDPEIAHVVELELGRQRDEIELIASENIVSRAVLEAQGSVLTNKYAEGLPGKRYYGGCQ